MNTSSHIYVIANWNPKWYAADLRRAEKRWPLKPEKQ